MRERHLRVDRTARYVQLGGEGGQVEHIWLACHGYRQLARYFARQVEPLAGEDRLLLVPEALNRFYLGDPDGAHGPDSRVGGTWMTREGRDAEIADYVGYLDRLYGEVADGEAAALHLLGFSQGAATAARWAVLGGPVPATLVLWGALLPPDLDLERHRARMDGLHLVVVAGARDPALSPARARGEVDRLADLGLDVDLRTHAGAHHLDDELLRELAEEAVRRS